MPRGHGEKLSRKMELGIASLLTCRSVEEAAEATGVTSKTLRGWMRDPAFVADYRAARRQAVESSIARLQQLTAKAAETVDRLMGCGTPAVELRAALGVLEHARAGVELIDILERVEALEALAAQGGKS